MSSFVVGPRTIHAVVELIHNMDPAELVNSPVLFELTLKGDDAVGQALIDLNLEATSQRYSHIEGERERLVEQIKANGMSPYVWDYTRPYSAEIGSTALRCLAYQCAEGNVPETALYKELEVIRDKIDPTLDVDGFWGQ